MLELREVHHPHQKQVLFKEYNPKEDTWLVSDLKSKLEIQKRFLIQGELLAEDSVLRVSELWRKFLIKGDPALRVISSDLARSLLSQWLEESEFEWAQSPGAAQNLFAYTAQLLPVLTHDQGPELLKEWWQDHADSLVRWGHWYQLASWAWQKLEEQKVVPAPWVSAWLTNWDKSQLSWPRRVFVDLGSELSAVEAEVLWQLAESTSVVVVAPGEYWRGRFEKSLRGYRILEEKLSLAPKQMEKPEISLSGDYQFNRYSTMLAEVKAAVSQVRHWLEQGVDASKVVLMAPDMEDYWPILSEYLAKEGIPAGKDQVVTIQSYPDVLRWLARLRVDAGMGIGADIELAAYSPDSRCKLPYEEFRRLFAIFYDVEDLQREKQIAGLFNLSSDSKATLTRDQFVAWSLASWPTKEATAQLELIFHQFFQDCPYSTTLSLRHWMVFLEKLCARMEIKVTRSGTGGVQILNLMSGEWVDASHIWVMGLTEEGMRRTETTGILLSDVLSLERDMGFYIHHPDRMQAEFEAEWMLDRSWEQAVLTTPSVDFSGQVQSPAMLWLRRVLEAGKDWEKCSVPERCRWDKIQAASVEKIGQISQWQDGHLQSMCENLPVELGEKPLPVFGDDLDISLSVSQLESYLECPFITAASKVFRLADVPDLDMDVDHMARGSLIHKLFEILTRGEKFRGDYTNEEMKEVVDQARQESELLLADERLWSPLRQKLVEMAQRFVGFESEWRKLYPKTATVGREIKVKCRWNPETKAFVDKDGEGVLFRGFIDRVDGDGEGHFTVLDYKSSPAGLTNYKSWLSHQSLQLSLYSHWLALGFTELGPGDVVGALYYVAKTLDRRKGFVLDEGIEDFSEPANNYHKLGREDRESLVDDVLNLVAETMEEILKGEFSPQPEKPEKSCQACRWRGLCRAPHLN